MRILLPAFLALCLTACGAAPPRPQSAFDGRVEDWAREIVADDPEFATRAGLRADVAGEGFETRLTDRSVAAQERARSAAERRLVELRAVDEASLTPEEAVTYAALSAQFETAAGAARFGFGAFHPLGGAQPYVMTPITGAYLDLADFFDTAHTIATLAEAETYVARLREAAGALDAEAARARADAEAGIVPPDFILDGAIAALDRAAATPLQAQTYVSALRTRLIALTPAGADGAPHPQAARAQSLLAQAEAITRDAIVPAHQRAAATLRALRPRATHEAGIWRLPNGAVYYAALLRFETTSTLSAEEIHQIGRARVAALEQELDVALRRLGRAEGSVGARLAALTADPRYQYEASDAGRAKLLADVRARVNRVMQRAPEWFETLPRAPLEVRRVPPIAEGAASGAYYDPPSLDGAKPGIYYINLRNLAEMTRIDLPTQDYHEAVPGHHFQVALARERGDLPLMRRLLSFTAYGEGWGLYAEQLADEQGLYREDPIGRIGYLRWQLWRAARLVVDTGIHAKRWSREQAIAYLLETTGDSPGVVISEVDRYVVLPGQACAYELGRREIVRLRELARNALGPDYDLRGFHSAILAEGELPFSALEARVRAYIDARRAAAQR